MLKASCRRFREEFTRGQDAGPADHRRGCDACDAWAGAVETAREWTRKAAVEDRPLPASLRSRLRSIPRQTATCRETDRLYDAARRRAAGGVADAAATEHLAACDRCRKLYDTLHAAFSETPEPPPPHLVAGLKQIARRRRHPVPYRPAEPRLAAVACILMTVLLSTMAADAAALFRDAGGAVSAKATDWKAEGETRSRRMWESAASASAASYRTSRERLAGFAESCERFFNETVRTFGSITEPYTETPDGGPRDGKSDSDTR